MGAGLGWGREVGGHGQSDATVGGVGALGPAACAAAVVRTLLRWGCWVGGVKGTGLGLGNPENR